MAPWFHRLVAGFPCWVAFPVPWCFGSVRASLAFAAASSDSAWAIFPWLLGANFCGCDALFLGVIAGFSSPSFNIECEEILGLFWTEIGQFLELIWWLFWEEFQETFAYFCAIFYCCF
ncbi:hypothetical protein MA16_Dca017017 [Dendrobium catenatum]|uniref:Uncharacterized protein n=1 Tax=Dendrobium catenatum TaxID=906689 RepID=A0A2I0XEW3_9ASPA|nr:hypothetical protein MA16_Dca017017 [Dendrobium catenatum]